MYKVDNLNYYVKEVKQMKNVIKKIAAVTMAFSLLGTGTTIAKTVNPEKFNVGITASATCNHRNPYATYGEWQYSHRVDTGEWRADWWQLGHIQHKFTYYYTRRVEWHCVACGEVLYVTHETKTEQKWKNV